MKDLEIHFLSHAQQNSEYDWANINFKGYCVGKARCLINGDVFTIFSINIYPEYQGNGYGKEFVEKTKLKYKKLIADRVRSKAIGFWENVGFIKDGETDNWVYIK
jgi:ribosomal protein S18 acetylase RimI-like enzyme